MRIAFVEIHNFRKLKAVRIDFAEETTLFVGANNSGKTSAMEALRYFLVERSRFAPNDFTLSHWTTIETIADQWRRPTSEANPPDLTLETWAPILPSLDLWFDVGMKEVQYTRHLLPTLDWKGGLLGVRLRFEPKSVDDLYKEFTSAINAAADTHKRANDKRSKDAAYKLTLWPRNMRDFLDRKMQGVFTVHAYLLDPKKIEAPVDGEAKPQSLPEGTEPVEGNPLDGLIRVDEIVAQRGFGDGSGGEAGDSSELPRKRSLSSQLSSYFAKHLDPFDYPDPEDLDALEAIEGAQATFDQRLAVGFAAALTELSALNYPGVTDPKLKIATKMRPTDGMNHSAAVQYDVLPPSGDGKSVSPSLPEEYNGLGYRNLISMVFKLMSFRDAWMRVGKAGKAAATETAKEYFPPPLHLVLLEEPEAHLHVQVQQVFVRKAYDVLRNHPALKPGKTLNTQLVVSTHSSHIAHETRFSCIRYFRRLPASDSSQVPTTAVINLSTVFGDHDDTQQFVTRYLRTAHCDLFFADAVILVEGTAERMLVPHFIRQHFQELHCCFVTVLEIGGRHAHRLRPLIEHLGMTTLVITDLDPVESAAPHRKTRPQRGKNQLTGNETLKTWHPMKTKIDELLDMSAQDKHKPSDIPLFCVRVAFQIPATVAFNAGGAPSEALAATFEDALVLDNLPLFKDLDGVGMIPKIKNAIAEHPDANDFGHAMDQILKDGSKAEFALDLLALKDPKELRVPAYIHEGLKWLQSQLERKQNEVLATAEELPASGGDDG